jgi:hypothetical protein
MALYEDEYVRLDENCVTLKWYYFPTFADKAVPRECILSIETLQNPSFFETKMWGVGILRPDVWWACGWKLNLNAPKKLIIITTVDDPVRKGFVCCDGEAFMAAYRRPR